MTPLQQDTQASYVRITEKALSLAGGRGDIIQRIAIRAGYRQPEDEENMLAKLFPSADPAHVVEPCNEPVLAAVMWMMRTSPAGWSDDEILYKVAEDLGLDTVAVGVSLPSFSAAFKRLQERPAAVSRSDLEPTTPLSAAVKDQLDHLAGEVRQQLDAGHMPNGNDLDRLARWAQQAARHGASDQAWREWAAKILAAYPWVDEFKPEDSDDKYRDGVRYVLLCLECNGNGGIAYATEMQEIKARWGFA